jgi:hypothetical protein
MSINYFIFMKSKKVKRGQATFCFIKGDRLLFELNRCHCERSVAISHIPNLAHFSSKKNSSIFSFHATLLSN